MITLSSLSPDPGGSPGQRDRRLPTERVWRGRRGPRHQRQDQSECSNLLKGLGSSVAPPNTCRLWAGDDPVRGGGQRPGVPGQRQEAPRQENKVGNDRRYRSCFLFLLPQRFRCSVSVGLHILVSLSREWRLFFAPPTQIHSVCVRRTGKYPAGCQLIDIGKARAAACRCCYNVDRSDRRLHPGSWLPVLASQILSPTEHWRVFTLPKPHLEGK